MLGKMLEWFKSLFGAQDMTVGKPSSRLLKFIIPMLISNIAQMLLTTIDRAIVGHFMGDTALAAVGASMPILNVFMVFFMAVGSGVTVMVAQFFGARDRENLSKTVGNTLFLMIIASVFVTAVATPLTGPILRAIDTTPGQFDYAFEYLVILFSGIATIGFYNVFAGVLRGVGSSMYPLIVFLCSVVLNAVLDLVFVAPWGLDLGIAGAAYATIIAQFGAAVVCLAKVLRVKHLFSVNRQTIRPNGVIIKQVIRLGLPSGLQMAIMFLSNIFMQPYLMHMGDQVMSAMTATMSIDGYAILPSQAFSMGISTYTGQNIGAGKRERIKPGIYAALRTSLGFSVIMVAVMLLFGRNALGLFTRTEALKDMGMSFIYIMIPAYLLMAVNMTFMGAIRGAGDSVGTMWLSIIINVIIKVPAQILLIHLSKSALYPEGDPKSMFYGMLITIAIGCILVLTYYRLGRWKTKAVVKTADGPDIM